MQAPRPPSLGPRAASGAAIVIASALAWSSACAGGGAADDAGSTSDDTTSGETTGGETSGAPLVGTCDPPLAAQTGESARLSVDADGRLRDPSGRALVLRGVNTGGRSKWAPFVPFPIADDVDLEGFRAAADAFFERLRPWGLNVVRLPFSWEGLEPTRGAYDARYLDRYEAMVESAWAHGLGVIVDFHQDIYASPFCGDGFPLWTLDDPDPGPPRRDCPGWGLKYFSDAGVRGAYDRFWADADGIQGDFLAMWAEMITRIGDHPGVVGVEIINEPGWGTATSINGWKSGTLAPFYEGAIGALRPLAPDLLFFYDDPGIDALAGSAVDFITPAGDGLVYAPHLYDVGLLAGEAASGISPESKLLGMAEHRASSGHAVLLGEFGVGGDAVALGGAAWIGEVMDSVDALGLSATLWECSQSDALWNDEDLSLLGPGGEERPLVDAYVRPWLRALAGSDAAFTWDPGLGIASATYTADGGISEIVLPLRRFPALPASVTVEGEGACYTYDPNLGELRVQAAAGSAVEVVIAD